MPMSSRAAALAALLPLAGCGKHGLHGVRLGATAAGDAYASAVRGRRAARLRVCAP